MGVVRIVRLMYCCSKLRSTRANPTGTTVIIHTQKCMTELFLLKELGERTEVQNNLQSDNKNRALDLPHTVTTAGIFSQFLYYHVPLVPGRAGTKLRKSQESKSKSELGSSCIKFTVSRFCLVMGV